MSHGSSRPQSDAGATKEPARDYDREARRIAPKIVACSREEARRQWHVLVERVQADTDAAGTSGPSKTGAA
jgi:hypothetical protein